MFDDVEAAAEALAGLADVDCSDDDSDGLGDSFEDDEDEDKEEEEEEDEAEDNDEDYDGDDDDDDFDVDEEMEEDEIEEEDEEEEVDEPIENYAVIVQNYVQHRFAWNIQNRDNSRMTPKGKMDLCKKVAEDSGVAVKVVCDNFKKINRSAAPQIKRMPIPRRSARGNAGVSRTMEHDTVLTSVCRYLDELLRKRGGCTPNEISSFIKDSVCYFKVSVASAPVALLNKHVVEETTVDDESYDFERAEIAVKRGSKMEKILFVSKSAMKDAGFGLFAGCDLPQDTCIGMYWGSVHEECPSDLDPCRKYAMQFSNKGKWLNHDHVADGAAFFVCGQPFESEIGFGYFGIHFANGPCLMDNDPEAHKHEFNIMVDDRGLVHTTQDVKKGDELYLNYHFDDHADGVPEYAIFNRGIPFECQVGKINHDPFTNTYIVNFASGEEWSKIASETLQEWRNLPTFMISAHVKKVIKRKTCYGHVISVMKDEVSEEPKYKIMFDGQSDLKVMTEEEFQKIMIEYDAVPKPGDD
jgi:hypothetical protein